MLLSDAAGPTCNACREFCKGGYIETHGGLFLCADERACYRAYHERRHPSPPSSIDEGSTDDGAR